MLVHYSTDYVFDGAKAKPYFEDDRPTLWTFLLQNKNSPVKDSYATILERGYVIRVSGHLWKSSLPCQKEGILLTTMVRLAKEKPEVRLMNDEILTPTSTFDIAVNSRILVEREPKTWGLPHDQWGGVFMVRICSWNFCFAAFEDTVAGNYNFENAFAGEAAFVLCPWNGLLKKEGMKWIIASLERLSCHIS